ncbi:MAG: phospho-sugar mutase, partial [Candidatus Fonsibacter sp.]
MVYTPLHGVGAELFLNQMSLAGFNSISVVNEQEKPDPKFPTVPFPNPEEKGALDLAINLAEKTSADLVIAHDPDADRCAIATKYDDKWQMWRG